MPIARPESDRPPYQYLFAVGCARSGTTNLVRALHSHEQVVMGMERFKHLMTNRRSGKLSPELFEPDRFLDFRPGDTNITPDHQNGTFRKHYEAAEARFRAGNVRYVGDKLMTSDRPIQSVADHFPEARVAFIFRDLLPVASSHAVQARRGGPTWRNHDDLVGSVVQSWQRAFAAADRLISQLGEERVFVVDFERFFDGNLQAWQALFDFLGLEMTDSVEAERATSIRKWNQRHDKELELSGDEIASLAEHADGPVVQEFKVRAERDLAGRRG